MLNTLIKTVRQSAFGARAVAAASIDVDALSGTETLTSGDIDFRTVDADVFGAAPNKTAAADDGIDLWILPRAAMARYVLQLALLSDDERSHAASLTRDEDRVRYIAVRVLLRSALSHRMKNEIESGHWKLTVNANGKPEIDPGQARLSFSISHAGAFSAIAVAADATIGIDAEKFDGERLTHLPTTCLTDKERTRLDKKDGEERDTEFFRLWTLKEAYTKALGLGFSAEFDQIEFDADRLALTRKAPAAPVV